MPTIVAQTIVDRAAAILHDATNVRWPSDELLKWLNDGQREVVLNKPDAGAVNANMLCVTGTKQSIPAAGIVLLSVVRNMGTNGTTPGRAITLIPRDVLDFARPGWHTETGAAETKHYVFDPIDPKRFYVYPPQPAVSPGYVEIIYSAAPSDVAIGAAINVDDIYANALLDYILYRAYSKDSEYAANPQRAAAHYQAFLGSVGIKRENDATHNPNLTVLPINPAAPGGAK